MAKETTSSGGVTFLGLLGLLFIGLKLCGAINWSWWWVTSPLWGGWVLMVTIFTIVALLKLATK